MKMKFHRIERCERSQQKYSQCNISAQIKVLVYPLQDMNLLLGITSAIDSLEPVTFQAQAQKR
jgi:hypothetical protein